MLSDLANEGDLLTLILRQFSSLFRGVCRQGYGYVVICYQPRPECQSRLLLLLVLALLILSVLAFLQDRNRSTEKLSYVEPSAHAAFPTTSKYRSVVYRSRTTRKQARSR